MKLKIEINCDTASFNYPHFGDSLNDILGELKEKLAHIYSARDIDTSWKTGSVKDNAGNEVGFYKFYGKRNGE